MIRSLRRIVPLVAVTTLLVAEGAGPLLGADVPRAASTGEWESHVAGIRARMEEVMGPFPGPREATSRGTPRVESVSEERAEGHVRRKIRYVVEGDDGRGGDDRVPAWLLLPDPAPVGRAPAMLCLHQTNAVGKDEPAGLGGLPDLAYARELVLRGYVCLVPDYPRFGEYRWAGELEGTGYASGSMKAVWNNVRGVDLLASLEEVDASRVGVIGHSLGGHNAIFTAAFDPRLRAVVSSCGFTPFPDYYRGDLTGWTSRTYMPRIARVWGGDARRVPFDFPEVIASLAPRGFFASAPSGDDNFDVAGVRRAVAEARTIFDLYRGGDSIAADRLVLVSPDAGHSFPPAQRLAAYEWLDALLGPGSTGAEAH